MLYGSSYQTVVRVPPAVRQPLFSGTRLYHEKQNQRIKSIIFSFNKCSYIQNLINLHTCSFHGDIVQYNIPGPPAVSTG
jgi:hypothetical protein